MRTVNDKIRWTSHSSFVHITSGDIKMVSSVRREVNEERLCHIRYDYVFSRHISSMLCQSLHIKWSTLSTCTIQPMRSREL